MLENLKYNYIGYMDPGNEAVEYYLSFLSCKIFILTQDNICYRCLPSGDLMKYDQQNFIFVNAINGSVWQIMNGERQRVDGIVSLYDDIYHLTCHPQITGSGVKWLSYNSEDISQGSMVINNSFSDHYDLFYLMFNSLRKIKEPLFLTNNLLWAYRIGLPKPTNGPPNTINKKDFFNNRGGCNWTIRGTINYYCRDQSSQCVIVKDTEDKKNEIQHINPFIGGFSDKDRTLLKDLDDPTFSIGGLKLTVINCRVRHITFISRSIPFATLSNITTLRMKQYAFYFPFNKTLDSDFTIKFTISQHPRRLPRPIPAILIYLYDKE